VSGRRAPSRARPIGGNHLAAAAHGPRAVSVVAVGIAVAAAACTGALLGARVGDTGARTSGAGAVRTVTGGGLRLTLPPNWTPARRPPTVPGVRFRRPIAFRERQFDVRIVAERLPLTSSTLLPPGLEPRLARPPGKPAIVRLGAGLRAHRYVGLVLRGSGRTLDVYAAPTTEGVATIVCSVEQAWRAAADSCEEVAASLVVPRAAGLPLRPDTAFRATLPHTVRVLIAARRDGRQGLATAATSRQQAIRAVELANAYRAASRTLDPLVRADDGAPARTVKALNRTARAYERLAAAARTGDTRGYRGASGEIVNADRALDEVVSRLDADARKRLAGDS
jgi:hypothetical protein